MKIRFNQPEQKIPDQDRGIRIHYGAAKRAQIAWRWYLIIIIASVPLLYLIGLTLLEMIVIKADGRVTVPNIRVRSSVDGYVQEFFVKPLQAVQKDQPLAVLHNMSLEDRYQRLTTEVNFLTQERDKLLGQPGNTQSHSMQLLRFAQQQAKFYQHRLQQYESLFKQGAATQAEIASARNQYGSALQSLALHQTAQSRDHGLSGELRQMSSRINELSLELDGLGLKKQQLTLIAPSSGLVTELFVQSGEYLGQGQPLLDIIFPEQAYITAFIPPKHHDRAVVDQIVSIAFPNGETAQGRIISVPGITQKSMIEGANLLESPRSAILAHVALTGPIKTQLINGMPVDIRFPFW